MVVMIVPGPDSLKANTACIVPIKVSVIKTQYIYDGWQPKGSVEYIRASLTQLCIVDFRG